MQKLQDSVFNIVKTTSLSSAVFSYLQPTEDTDKTPQGGILSDTKYGWLALGPKFCVVDLRNGLKIAAWTFGTALSSTRISVTSVIELPTPLTENSKQLIISLEYEDITGLICVFHVNGSQVLRCIQTEAVVAQLAVCDRMPDGPFTCFDGVVLAGTKSGEIFAFDLNRSGLIQALQDTSQGLEHLVRNEHNMANITFLPLNAVPQIVEQRELAIENDDHLAVLLNQNSLVDGQYIFHNPDGTIRMKAKRDHIRVSTMQYIPQLGSLAVGYNFGAFQIWNLLTLELELTSQVNVECLPVTHFGFQEPCDDPRAFCYLWVVYSVMDRFEEEVFPLAVMYSLTYQGKRMLSDTKYLYQDFSTSNIRFQIELSTMEGTQLEGARCVSCHTYCVNSTLGEGEDSMLNICQLVWECWGENANSVSQYGMLLFDLDQWYKDQMPATYQLQSNAFMSATTCTEVARGEHMLDVQLVPSSLAPYSHATRLEEHFYPNSLHYNCVCLSTSEATVLNTTGIQRQIISSMLEVGGSALLNPGKLYSACVAAGLTPLYVDLYSRSPSVDDQRRFLLSVALEARLSSFLKRCAHDWATGSHSGAGCTLPFLVNWCWKRAIELKQNAKELTAPLFTSSALPDRNVVRCLEHCVRQLTELTSLLDAILTKCCNLVVPDALSEMEEKYKGIGCVSLYFQVVQWFLGVGLLPERQDTHCALPYPTSTLRDIYHKRRVKLHRLQDSSLSDDEAANTSCPLLYIDQLIEHECDGDRIHEMWRKGGSENNGLYPPPSLYSLLRLYLLPDIGEQHKHSLVLYLLVDYSMLYDELRYEVVIRRLMQFPTMFGLSNTAIKATQAFWHLDHRYFDFALDQLQCLTGNTLSEWQHQVVLSALLAQKKTQAALQYLHVRKPAPIQNIQDDTNDNKNNRVNDHDKLDDWQSCCNLYLARGLVFEALDVIRMCVKNAGSLQDKLQVLNFFFKACRNTGHLSKILQISLLPFEEEVFIRYLESSNDPQASDILVMYYLQQARYLEAQQYNTKLKPSRGLHKDISMSLESILGSVADRTTARDTLVDVVCSTLPNITSKVAHAAIHDFDSSTHVIAPKPMSVFVQAKSPKNTFTYKSSFIQDTIENASETWMNKPKMKRGLKRALNVEETPFLCTPKLNRTKSIFTHDLDFQADATPSKRPKLDLTGTPKTPRMSQSNLKVSDKVSEEMQTLLEMPEIQTPPQWKLLNEIDRRSGRDTTPHSILKVRRSEAALEAPSPVDSRYLGESDDEMVETASNHTHFSDSKHLRFEIPTPSNPSESSTPSPPTASAAPLLEHRDLVKEREISNATERERDRSISASREREMDVSSYTTASVSTRSLRESRILESPPKKLATEEKVQARKSFKDTVKARRTLSISANSSLTEDPNTSIESIADIPITLINPRYSGERFRKGQGNSPDKKPEETTHFSIYHDGIEANTSVAERRDETAIKIDDSTLEGSKLKLLEYSVKVSPKTPTRRRSIRGLESTPLVRSRSTTPDRLDSPVATPVSFLRANRSKSRTPEPSSKSSLEAIPELPKQEVESEPHERKSTLSAATSHLRTRSRSRTPERIVKLIESPKLEAITESPAKPKVLASPSKRSLRSRSRTPERLEKTVVEATTLEPITESPTKTEVAASPRKRSLRSRSRTPERLEKAVVEAPTLEAITESPTKSEVAASPSKRNLRSRSRTPEVEIARELPASPRGLRSRSKTPDREKVMSPIEKPKSTKKSLSRLVLEHNAFAKTKTATEIPETDHNTTAERSILKDEPGSSIECTPMKSYNPKAGTLMDVEFSPIINKSVLQSSVESFENDSKSSHSSTRQKSLPGFSISDSYLEKSVLKSYQSSIADNIETSIEEGVHISTEIKYIKEPLGNMSSLSNKSVLKDVSSLMTSDSDTEMKDHSNISQTEEEKHDQAKKDIYEQIRENTNTIQKEKQRIVEIEREINEIEDDISEDESESGAEIPASESDDEMEQDIGDEIELGSGDDDDEVSEDESTEDDETDTSADNTDDEDKNVEDIISIIDSSEEDNNSSSSENKLQIDEQSNPDSNLEKTSNKITENKEKKIDIRFEVTKDNELTREQNKDEVFTPNEPSTSIDPLYQAGLSILTDDNSLLESDHSNVNLNYSDEDMQNKESGKDDMRDKEIEDSNEKSRKVENIIKEPNVVLESITKKQNQPELQVQIEAAVEIVRPEEEPKPTSATADIDTVDAATPKPAIIKPIKDISKEQVTKHQIVETVGEKMEVIEKKKTVDAATPTPAIIKPIKDISKVQVTKDQITETVGEKIEVIEKTKTDDVATVTPVIIKPIKDISKVQVTKDQITESVGKKREIIEENKTDDAATPTPAIIKPIKDISKVQVTKDQITETVEEKMEVIEEKETDDAATPTPAIIKPIKDIPKVQVTKDEITKTVGEKMEVITELKTDKPAPKSRKRTVSASSNKTLKESEHIKDDSEAQKITEKTTSRKRTKSTSSNKSVKEPTENTDKILEERKADKSADIENTATETTKAAEPKTPLRKRATSTSSNKSAKETEITDIPEPSTAVPQTPVTRKRTKSTSSNKSELGTPPEQKEQPRSKTPSSTEVRRVLTRRASKELSESKIIDESQEIDESLSLTPKRRTTRSRSKNFDDNASVASETSVKSTQSKASHLSEDDAKDVKAAPIRKTRKSILMTKPELSVIPEISTDEAASKIEEGDENNEYSSSRRLTRHQKALLDSWHEPKQTPSLKRAANVRRSVSRASVSESVDDDASSTSSVQFDRIELLNKTDFEGTPDIEEFQNNSAGSPILDSRGRRQTLVRAASESRTMPKTKPMRRISVDIANLDRASPVPSSTGSDVTLSPGRARRACFNKACEALSTPKGRRLSTDLKRADSDSTRGSPAPSDPDTPAFPSRRAKRTASTQSNTSVAKSDTSRRSKKSAAADEK